LESSSWQLILVAQCFSACVRKTQIPENTVEQILAVSSPAGTTYLSPALQRGVKWDQRSKSHRDDPFLTHTLQRCDNGPI